MSVQDIKNRSLRRTAVVAIVIYSAVLIVIGSLIILVHEIGKAVISVSAEVIETVRDVATDVRGA
jgi:hypothetical protein